jgi:membrane-bound serine protease (ClpP class)
MTNPSKSMKIAAFVCLLLVTVLASDGRAVVYLGEVEGVISPVTVEYVGACIDKADKSGAALLILREDTPGGLMDSMEKIDQKIFAAKTPVVVYVGPSGARAASAGFYILLASDVAVMAPGTHTGAAHPVSAFPSGQEEKKDDTMFRKAESDAAADIRSNAEKRGRNVQLAEEAVRESRSFTEKEALEGKLIDYVCSSPEEIVKTLDGKKIKRFTGEEVVLDLKNQTIEKIPMTIPRKILSAVAHPHLALLLFLLGVLGIYVEVTHPGLIFPGVVGVISILLAFYAFALLPVNYTGLLLILLAIGMFILEVKVTSYGLLTVGGIVSMIFGCLMLFSGAPPELRVSLYFVVPVAVAVGVIMTVLLGLVVASRRFKVATGSEGIVGEIGKAVTAIHQEGKVFVHGEYWNAYSEQPVPEGKKIKVLKATKDLKLVVEEANDRPA